eukprot:jgi/Bigna1/73231/fgenesh1_pg.23_\
MVTCVAAFARSSNPMPQFADPEPGRGATLEGQLPDCLSVILMIGMTIQLRAGTHETEEHRAKVCNLPPSFSVCPLCNAEVVQSVNHLIHHCTHLNAERCKLLSHMRSALGSASSLHSSFFDAPDSSKTKILLGAPSDDPIVDRRVDMAFRKFLLRVEVLRRQNFAAGVIASQ